MLRPKKEIKQTITNILDTRGPSTRRAIHLHLYEDNIPYISLDEVSQLLQEMKRQQIIATRGHGSTAVWFRVVLEGRLSEGYRGPHKKTYKELYEELKTRNRDIMDGITRLNKAAKQDAKDAYNWRTLMSFLNAMLQQQEA